MTVNKFSLFWEIPLAILSFFFYKAMKFLIGNLYTIYLAIDKKKTSQWRILSAETLKSALSLPVLMTKGPRWNTHAIIGTLGPFFVQESIAIDLNSANNSARSWIAVIYSFPGYETIASIESEKIDAKNQWEFLNLKSGSYSIGLRYYNCFDKIIYPAIQVDKRDFVSPTPVLSNINDFYHELIKKKNWFYQALHYYIFTILRLRKWLPESFVRNEYLPVGAPATEFFYDYLITGQTLQLEINSLIVKNYDIYLTVYDRSSLPLFWSRVEQEKYTTQPIPNNGFYLIRVRPKPHLFNDTNNLPIESRLIDKDNLVRYLQIFPKT